MSINNNAITYGLTGSTEPGSIKPNSTEPGTARRGNKVNIENFTVNINFLDCYFNNNRWDLALPPIFPLWSITALQLLYLLKPPHL